MTDKEKIRKFLEGMANADCCVTQVAKVINKIILPYIDSLQEEPVSEDLEAEIHNKIMMLHTAPCYDELADFARHFSKWQKQQMLKDATSRVVHIGEDLCPFIRRNELAFDILNQVPGIKAGDKVKIIIIKEG